MVASEGKEGGGMRTTAPVRIRRNGYEYVRLPSEKEGYYRLLIDQQIQFGLPCIRGTRIPAESIAAHHRAGDSVLTLARLFDIAQGQVQACVDYVNAPVKAMRVE